MVLLGCKSDLGEERKVSYEEGLKMAERYGMPFYEASAKMNVGIEPAFMEITEMIYRKQLGLGKIKGEGVDNTKAKLNVQEKGKKCC